MRVLLSGTSNSIMAKSLNYSFPNDPAVSGFINHSYGASGTVALGDHLRKIDFSQHDFCVLDYCVNEDEFINQNRSSVSSAINNLAATIDAASSTGCQPILVAFRSTNRPARIRPLEEAITDQLQARGVPVFNFFNFAKMVIDQSDLRFEDLFLDRMHVHREVGRLAGSVAIKYMQSVAGAGAADLRKTDLTYCPISFVGHEDMELNGQGHIETRESRLIAAQLLHVAPGGQLRVPVPAGLSDQVDVIGVTCNAAATIGTLQGATQDAPLIVIDKPNLFRKARQLTMVSLPAQNPLRMTNGAALIDYTFTSMTSDQQLQPGLEILGLILRNTGETRTLHIATCAKAPTALETWVTPAEISILVEQIVSLSPAS